MKKLLTLLLAAVMVFALAACGNSAAPAGSAEAQSGEITTLGDALRMGRETQYVGSWNDEQYVYVFDNNGVPTRVAAPMTAELVEQMESVLFSDAEEDEKDAKVLEIIGGQPVTSVEDLTSEMLSQEELDALVGKTGQELLDAGWTDQGSHWDGGDGLVVEMTQGIFDYEIHFNESAEFAEDQSAEEVIPDLTVKSAAYYGFADCITDLP